MELVRRESLSPAAEKIILPGSQIHITKPHQTRRPAGMARENSGHLVFFAVRALQGFLKILKAAAFRNSWHPGADFPGNLLQHPLISRKLLCVQFRVPAAQQKPLQILRERGICQRAERY